MECYRIPGKAYTVTAFGLFSLLALFVGAVLFPSVFWDGLIWPYLWGPVVADAYGTSIDGVIEGYNALNTIVYGLVLSLAVYWCYALLRKLHIEADWKFIMALLPYIILGGTMRALEDARLFRPPVSYFFIAPVIYLTLASLVVLGLFFTWLFLKRVPMPMMRWGRGALFLAGDLMAVGILLVIFVGTTATRDSFSIIWIVLSGIAAYGVSRLPILRDPEGGTGYLAVTAANGAFILFISILYIQKWLFRPWEEGFTTYPGELVIIPAIFALASAAVLLALWLGSFKIKKIQMFTTPTSAIIICGHLLDAAATYRGIAKYGYVEKHVVPRFLIEASGTPMVMFVFKLVVALFVLYILEGQLKEEIKDKTLMGLLRLAVLVLGMSPGIRSILRIVMGV